MNELFYDIEEYLEVLDACHESLLESELDSYIERLSIIEAAIEVCWRYKLMPGQSKSHVTKLIMQQLSR